MPARQKILTNGAPCDWTASLVLVHVLGIVDANDSRYKEAFAAAKEAVATAFIASEKATAQAFASSEKAIRDALAAVEKATAAAFVAAEKAVALAEANAERWRQDAQEWRARMTDREKEFATKIQADALKERLDRGDGSNAGSRASTGTFIGVAGLVVAVATAFAALIMRH